MGPSAMDMCTEIIPIMHIHCANLHRVQCLNIYCICSHLHGIYSSSLTAVRNLKLPDPAQFLMYPASGTGDSQHWGGGGELWGRARDAQHLPRAQQILSSSSFPQCWCAREMFHDSYLKATERFREKGRIWVCALPA